MEKDNMIGKAAELLAKCEVVTLASITEDGYPRICVMAKVKTEGIRTIWMATSSRSAKTGHFQNNPKASSLLFDGGSVTLLGNASRSSTMQRFGRNCGRTGSSPISPRPCRSGILHFAV